MQQGNTYVSGHSADLCSHTLCGCDNLDLGSVQQWLTKLHPVTITHDISQHLIIQSGSVIVTSHQLAVLLYRSRPEAGNVTLQCR